MTSLSNMKFLTVRGGDKYVSVHVYSGGKEVEIVQLDKYAALNLIRDLSEKLGQSI